MYDDLMYYKLNKVGVECGTGFIYEHNILEYDTLSLHN
jgi:hypothetical protein